MLQWWKQARTRRKGAQIKRNEKRTAQTVFIILYYVGSLRRTTVGRTEHGNRRRVLFENKYILIFDREPFVKTRTTRSPQRIKSTFYFLTVKKSVDIFEFNSSEIQTFVII